MRKYSIITLVAVSAFILVTGCSCSSSNPPFKATRVVDLQKQIPDGSTPGILTARAGNGYIIAKGTDSGRNIDVKATIHARGWDQAQADSMADQVVVSIIENGADYSIDVQKPQSELSRHISLSYDINAPKHVSMDLHSSNGKIQVFDFDFPVKAHTSNGSITVRNVTAVTNLGSSNGSITTDNLIGPTKVKTSNGSITYNNFAGDFDANTSNGRITAHFSHETKPDVIITARTSNAGVNINLPPDYSGQVHLSTSNGSVSCDRPVTVQGKIGKNNIQGKIGDGTGKLTVRTSNGSISVK